MGVLSRSLLIGGIALVAVSCGGSALRHGGLSAPGHGILFTSSAQAHSWCRCGGDIYLWASVVSQPVQLTNSPADPKSDAHWAPDGREIAWAMVPPAICKQDSEACGGKFGCAEEVFIASSNGSDVRQVSPPYRDSSNNPGCSTAPSWSPDGKQLVFLRESSTAPSNFAILTLRTRALRLLHVRGADIGSRGAWGKPGIAYISAHNYRTHHPPYGGTIYEIRVVNPSSGGLRFAIPLHSELGTYPIAWSPHGDLASIQGKRIVIYSSTGRKVADFSAPRSREAPALTSPLVWSPDGHRLLVCLDPFGGLSSKAHQKLINTAAKRSHYPAPVPYLVDRDGTRWQRFQLPNLKKRESICSATSWR